ncbi:alpha/beta fold hydrolase [Paenibacillus sp. JTLBN-2024]
MGHSRARVYYFPSGIHSFMDMFREEGFNVLLVDQRRHGKSEGKYTTYGYHEKHDVAAWVRYIKDAYGENCVVGLHGVSLGGGTVLEYLSLPEADAKFVIADCPYSDLTRLMHHQLQRLNHLPAALFLPLVNARMRKGPVSRSIRSAPSVPCKAAKSPSCLSTAPRTTIFRRP